MLEKTQCPLDVSEWRWHRKEGRAYRAESGKTSLWRGLMMLEVIKSKEKRIQKMHTTNSALERQRISAQIHLFMNFLLTFQKVGIEIYSKIYIEEWGPKDRVSKN